MIAVIFEVKPAAGKMDEYMNIAAKLRPELEKIDGFISIERFQSLSDDSKILSLSFFENEEALTEWRNLQSHRFAQAMGRATVFDDYRLRIAGVIRDYGMIDRAQAPEDSQKRHAE